MSRTQELKNLFFVFWIIVSIIVLFWINSDASIKGAYLLYIVLSAIIYLIYSKEGK